jgi:ABC-2 type transporter
LSTGRILSGTHAVVVFAWREFRTETPIRLLLGTVLPRQALQCLFFTLLVKAGQPGFAFVGGVSAVQTVAAVMVTDVVLHDKIARTSFRLRTGVLSMPAVLVMRTWPHILFSVSTAAVVAVTVAPLVGLGYLLPRLVPLVPVYLISALSTTFAGLAIAILASRRRLEALAGNLLSYAVILGAGVYIPAGRLPWIDAVGFLLPIRHGLAAVRAALEGRPFGAAVGFEAAVAGFWLVAAWLAAVLRERQARRSGIEAV